MAGNEKARLQVILRKTEDRLKRIAKMLGAEAIRLGIDEAQMVPAEKKEASDVEAVYGEYCRIMRRSPERYRLTQGRAKKIAARLSEGFTVEALVEAARNMELSDFHMGKNEAGRKYNDLAEHLYKSYEKTEAWVEGRPVEKRLETEGRRRKEDEWAREQTEKRRREREEFLKEKPKLSDRVMDEMAKKLGVTRKRKDAGNDTDKR